MSSTALVRGMGSFFKECEHPRSRWSTCAHLYKIRYRSAAGKQVKESGFSTQDQAIARLTEIYVATEHPMINSVTTLDEFTCVLRQRLSELEASHKNLRPLHVPAGAPVSAAVTLGGVHAATSIQPWSFTTAPLATTHSRIGDLLTLAPGGDLGLMRAPASRAGAREEFGEEA
ncbi:hypothetical protein RKD49_007282 [Streptomyces glaucescens]